MDDPQSTTTSNQPTPQPASGPATPAPTPSAPPVPSVGDEIDGLGIVFGVRVIRDDGTYVQIGSADANWIKL